MDHQAVSALRIMCYQPIRCIVTNTLIFTYHNSRDLFSEHQVKAYAACRLKREYKPESSHRVSIAFSFKSP